MTQLESIKQYMKDKAEAKVSDIAGALGFNVDSVRGIMSVYCKNGIFERVGRGIFRLKKEA